jgi:hypothetical protein
MAAIEVCLPSAIAIAQVKTSTTVVRMAVARLESMPATPILARIAVAAAKSAERSAQRSQVMQYRICADAMLPWSARELSQLVFE